MSRNIELLPDFIVVLKAIESAFQFERNIFLLKNFPSSRISGLTCIFKAQQHTL